jgi:hypothetical protein
MKVAEELAGSAVMMTAWFLDAFVLLISATHGMCNDFGTTEQTGHVGQRSGLVQ